MTSNRCGNFTVIRDLKYPFTVAPEFGCCLQVAPGVHWLRMPMPFALNHVNLWLLEDGDGWTLVDCGIAREDVKLLWQQLYRNDFQGRALKRVIVTHCHADHIGLAGWLLENYGCRLWMSEGEYRLAADIYAGVLGWREQDSVNFLHACGLPEERIRSSAHRPEAYRSRVAKLPKDYGRLAHGSQLSINGRTWQVLIAKGHSPELVCLFCPELELLIGGDQVLAEISSNVSVWPNSTVADPLKSYLESMTDLFSLPGETLVLPSHGRPFYGLHKRLLELDAHHAERLGAIRESCRVSLSVAELLPVLFKRPLNGQQLHFAVGETLAHLNYLWLKDELSRELNDGHQWRFNRR